MSSSYELDPGVGKQGISVRLIGGDPEIKVEIRLGNLAASLTPFQATELGTMLANFAQGAETRNMKKAYILKHEQRIEEMLVDPKVLVAWKKEH